MRSSVSVILSVMSMLPLTAQTLHYDRPARYFEEALVLGNGTLGATVYGGVDEERISLNDLTLWTGEPSALNVYSPDAWRNLDAIREALNQEDYARADRANRAIQGDYTQNYQPLGNLFLTDLSTKGQGDKVQRDKVQGDEGQSDKGQSYYRSLDLPTATATVRYGAMERQYFVSAPDSVLVIRLRAQAGQRICQRIGFSSLLPIQKRCVAQEGSADLIVSGYTAYASSPNYADSDYRLDAHRGIHFRTIVRVLPVGGGKVRCAYDDALLVEDCPEVLILVANVTSFNGAMNDPYKQGRDYKLLVKNRMDKASAKAYDALHRAHVQDFRSFFDRVEIDLGTTDPALAALPTDVQLKRYGETGQPNPDLEELYFQFGRYLLISCSRTEGVPANLQGLWNEHLLPPWSCNYTTNINLEENYWPAEVANLSEMHRPMLDFVQQLPVSGAITAKNYYGVQRGWCLGHNTDIWGLTNPVGRRGGDPCWASWNMGGAWVSTHLWEHYMFTLDKAFLAAAYPTLKGAADFCLDWLVPKEVTSADGKRATYLLTSPCTSPENRYLIPSSGVRGATFYGGFADIAMIRECLEDTRMAAQELGLDKAYRDTLDDVLRRLLPYRIGERGNLQEFFHDWEGEDPQHRHQSHLFGLYPGHHITVAKTPALAKACARSLEIKGPKSTGWSTGWRINLQARLHDAEMAYSTYRMLLSYVAPDGKGGGTYPNLLDAHSPFQIDGNFGGAAGVMEMLLQSSYVPGQVSEVQLLPALPKAWQKSGRVHGLCVRGGFVVDFAWQNGRITELTVHSRRSDSATLRLSCGKQRWKVSLDGHGQKTIVRQAN